MPTPKNRRGRPKGRRNHAVDQTDAHPTRCQKCGSTDRDAYSRTTATAFAGLDPDGRPYTHLVRRWTRCRKCGQHRIDRYYESRT